MEVLLLRNLLLQLSQFSPSPPVSAPCNIVTESKLILLAARLLSNLRDKGLEQGIATLFGERVDRENGSLVSQRTILHMLEFRVVLY